MAMLVTVVVEVDMCSMVDMAAVVAAVAAAVIKEVEVEDRTGLTNSLLLLLMQYSLLCWQYLTSNISVSDRTCPVKSPVSSSS